MRAARDNPFAVHRVLRVRYRLDEAAWAGLFARLETTRGRGAIVGPHGAGKTTLLEDLVDRADAAGWRTHLVRLSEDVRRVPRAFWREIAPTLGPNDLVAVDGAEQLSPLTWWWLRWRARRAGLLLITAHRAGRLPVLRWCSTSPALLCEITEALGVPLARVEAGVLHARHRGNLREALRELYDRWAG